LKKIRKIADVRILGVQELVFAAIVFDTIGAIVNCQAVYFHLMLKKHMIGPLKDSSGFGVRN
jgi:hypothetical protein